MLYHMFHDVFSSFGTHLIANCLIFDLLRFSKAELLTAQLHRGIILLASTVLAVLQSGMSHRTRKHYKPKIEFSIFFNLKNLAR